MAKQMELAKHRLFDRDALDVSNIKLYPGTNRETTPEQMAEQINRALTQIEAGDFEVLKDDEED